MSDVAIVWNEGKGDILSRFARALSNGTGWKIVRKPDPKAAINYFMLYIQVAQSPQGLNGLQKTAALFSHLEEEVPKKAAWWNAAAPLVDIRTTWAQQYLEMLLPYGDSFIVTPPIDKQFLTGRKKPVVGVSGYVHPGGRKGEGILKRLYDECSAEFDIVASGQGWPIPASRIKERKWEEMPAFYDSLDVYLVTSLTEGIPMPPLEALAQGKRVVVPNSVGLLDELNSELVFRYERGSYSGMLSAIRGAIEYGAEDVGRFSEDAWCHSHKQAFGFAPIKVMGGQAEFYGAPVVSKTWINSAAERYKELNGRAIQFPVIDTPAPPKRVPKSGAVVVAYGAPARECAQVAIASWKKHMRGYPIALISDAPLPIEDGNELEDIFIQHKDTDIGARSVKTQLYDLVPAEWDNVLYLDADTEIVADVSALFQWLADGFDFLICTNPGLYSTITQGARPDNREELEVTITEVGNGGIIQFNGGVFAFKRGDAGAALMRGWHSEWLRWKARDQFALIRALHKNPVKLLLLTNEWNTIVRFCDPSITAGILHYALRARRWAGIIQGPLDSKEAWDRVIK
jgi:hypothetical protein